MRQPVFVHSMPAVCCIDCGLLALKMAIIAMTMMIANDVMRLRKMPLIFESSVGVRAVRSDRRDANSKFLTVFIMHSCLAAQQLSSKAADKCNGSKHDPLV